MNGHVLPRNESELVRQRLERALHQAQERMQRDPRELWFVSVPSVSPGLGPFLHSVAGQPFTLLLPPRGRATMATGETAVLRASGPDRIDDLHVEARKLFASALVIGEMQPQLLGGLAFAASRTAGPWQSFGDARFVLPRWAFCFDGAPEQEHRGWLAVSGHGAIDVPALLEEFDRLVSGANVRTLEKRVTRGAVKPADDRKKWDARVHAALAAIDSQRLEKVVCAREVVVPLAASSQLADVVLRTRVIAKDSTLYAFAHDAHAFIGLTPERLVRLWEGNVFTEAVAGTAKHNDLRSEQVLLATDKERHEHRVVVDAITTALRAHCTHLEISPTTVKRLATLSHLWTTIRGRLANPQHSILQLVRDLHPTPAVAGLPSLRAQSFIVEHEPFHRGWYAGPVGWFDMSGEGEFYVALRCALLAPKTAILYAGAGIVAASDANAEWDETERKLGVMRRTLGLDVAATEAERAHA